MSRKKRYIKEIKDLASLEKGMKSTKGGKFSQRCHAILLSYRGYDTEQLGEIFQVSNTTLYKWFDRYESEGVKGLEIRPGRGRKATLRMDNKSHVEAVDKAVAKVNKKGGNLLAEIESRLDLERGLTKKIVRTFLKKVATSGNEDDAYSQ